MKVLIVGTSNCLLNGGVKESIINYFGSENVTNLSIGASSGTFLSLFRLIEGVDFRNFDYVFFDSTVNEQWQVANGRSPQFLWKIARILYGSLPPGVTYIYLGFCILPRFKQPDIVEHIHRSLCMEFGINFVPLRQLLTNIALAEKIDMGHLYVPFDPSHFKLPLIRLVMDFVLKNISHYGMKLEAGKAISEYFFKENITNQASATTIQSTSLRTVEYGQFFEGDRIELRAGILLGFDHCELETEAILYLNAPNDLQKALHFVVDKPWMKFAAFNDEIPTNSKSYIEVLSEPVPHIKVEPTDGTLPINRKLTGRAKIADLFYAKIPIDEIIRRTQLNCSRPPANFVSIEELFDAYFLLHRNELVDAALS